MNLRSFLSASHLTDGQFAERVGASEAAVRKWKYGERTPRPEVMVRIRTATNGAVTADDFLPAPVDEAAA